MNKNKSSWLPFSIILFMMISIFSTSCIDNSAEEEIVFQQMVDTLYNREIRKFNANLDSLCELQRDSLILSNMDSIKQLRLIEIEKLIKK